MDAALARRIDFLEGIPDPALLSFVAGARRVPFAKGELVLCQGTRNASLYLVQEGTLHVRRKTKGPDVMLGRLEAGSAFGEMSVFDPAPTSAEVVGVTPGVLLEVDAAALDRFLDEHPAAGRLLLTGLLRQMARRLREADARIADSLAWHRVVS